MSAAGRTVRVGLVPTGTANLASVEAAFARAGAEAYAVREAPGVIAAERLVVPGVGTFGAAMERLRERGLVDALRERVTAGRPTLAICVGLQVLARSSEESPGVEGLGVLPLDVRRFSAEVVAPQLGWNRVEPDAAFGGTPGYAYFANTFRIAETPGEGWAVAWAEHGGRFVAAIRRGGVLGCQFHPELSGPWGAARIASWIAEVPSC